MKRLSATVVLVLSFVSAGTAYAGNGYYCVGRGYVAYQFGYATYPPEAHRLSVIRFSDTSGIESPAVLDLPQFQVHGLQCGEGWIDVAAFTAIYHVTLDEHHRPVRYEVQPFANGQSIPQASISSQLQNLGGEGGRRAYQTPVRVHLSSKERGGGYVLEITAKVIPPLKKCELAVTSRIVETDRDGREISARIIFQGRGYRECGE